MENRMELLQAALGSKTNFIVASLPTNDGLRVLVQGRMDDEEPLAGAQLLVIAQKGLAGLKHKNPLQAWLAEHVDEKLSYSSWLKMFMEWLKQPAALDQVRLAENINIAKEDVRMAHTIIPDAVVGTMFAMASLADISSDKGADFLTCKPLMQDVCDTYNTLLLPYIEETAIPPLTVYTLYADILEALKKSGSIPNSNIIIPGGEDTKGRILS